MGGGLKKNMVISMLNRKGQRAHARVSPAAPCRRAVRVRRDGRSNGQETCVRECTLPPCYGEREERRRRDIEWARPGTTWPPPLSKALALCHVVAHNEAARWASVILTPGLVFCLPENSLLCRAALRPTAVSFRTGTSVHLVVYDIRISIKAFNTNSRIR